MTRFLMLPGFAFALALAGAAAAQAPDSRPAPDRSEAWRMMERPTERLMDRTRARPGGPAMQRVALGQGRADGLSLLRAADTDGDGVATRAELDALMQAEFAFLDRNGDGVVDIADAGPTAQRMAALRAARPADPWAARPGGRDGEMRAYTRDDVTARLDGLFARLDADSDGRITAAEGRADGARGPRARR